MTLDDLDMDALTEIFNLGVGQAAYAFSQIAGDAVQLSVPRVSVLSHQDVAQRLEQSGHSAVSAVRQRFSGAITSEAVLMFPADRGLQLVQMMVGGDLPVEQVADMEQEALSEVGNILLNSVMASVADVLQIELDGSLPVVEQSDVSRVLNLHQPQPVGGAVLLIDIQFEVAAREVQGLLAFLLDVSSQDELERLIGRFIERL